MHDELEWMRQAVHDLCQPLTALECRLFLGTLDETAEAMQTSILEARVQSKRLLTGVRELQARLEERNNSDRWHPHADPLTASRLEVSCSASVIL